MLGKTDSNCMYQSKGPPQGPREHFRKKFREHMCIDIERHSLLVHAMESLMQQWKA